MLIDSSYQALASDASWDLLYDSLPTDIQSDAIEWDILHDETTEETILFGDITSWIRFMVGFFQLWAEADWMPTFDMLLIHEEHNMDMRTFKGMVTVIDRPPERAAERPNDVPSIAVS